MRRARFTLVEMVIAMGIMIFVAVIIGTASSIFYKAYSRSVKQTERLKEYIAVDQVMDQCVRNAIPIKWKDENDNSSRFLFQGETDSLIFAALRRSHARDKGGLIFIRLRLDDTDLVAEYSSYPLLPWELEEEDRDVLYTREVLSRNVRSISFLYAERDTDGEIEFLEEWIEDDHSGIPLAIQLEIEWNNGDVERWLRRTAGSAANTSYGNRQDQSGLQQNRSGRGGSR